MNSAILVATYQREYVQDGQLFNFKGVFQGEKIKRVLGYDTSNFDFVEGRIYMLSLEKISVSEGTINAQITKIKEL